MDAGHVVTELRRRGATTSTGGAREAVETFFAFAAEPVSYEDGGISTDMVVVGTGVIDDVSHWYPEDTRPELGSVLLSVSREIGIEDAEGDQLDEAQAFYEIVFAPSAAADIDEHLDLQGPAGSDDDEYDFPTLEATRESVLASLERLLEHPPTGMKIDGHAPLTPTEASLASPALEPVRLVGDDGGRDAGYAPDDFDRQFRGRRLGRRGSWDTTRTVELLVEFCARPLQHGAFTVVRDEAVIDFNQPFGAEDDDGARLTLEREIDLVGPDGDEETERIGCTLLFDVTAEIAALPDWHTIRASTGATTTPGTTGDVAHLGDLLDAFRASPIAPLLDHRADGHRPATTI
ncbi:hypothetical protein [Patulibacter sp.]|uniref:hypothetical protein n=1 Tax=Patulibacter sp. TaxID=1912859 RepID=UPI0027178EA9|nr:hypothetical protein [Patulibacter sp.]MDO9410475.1 hypothetical protein [Patulibacter sp.]